MRNILKADFFKLKKSRAFLICLLLILALGVLIVFALQAAFTITESVGPEAIPGMTASPGGAWALGQVLSTGFHLVIIAVLTALFVSSEFVYGPMKNMLSRGAGRLSVFFSKFLVSCAASLAILFVYMLAGLVTGTLLWGFDPAGLVTASGMLGMILPQTLLTLSFTAVFLFISTTLRSSGGAIAVNIICATMVSTLLSALNMLLKLDIDLGIYWLEGAIGRLATITPDSGDVVRGVIVGLVWMAVSLAAGGVLFRKLDVK